MEKLGKTELFENYEEDYHESMVNLSNFVQSFCETTMDDAQYDLDRCESSLLQMELELKLMPPKSFLGVQSQIRNYRKQFEGAKIAL